VQGIAAVDAVTGEHPDRGPQQRDSLDRALVEQCAIVDLHGQRAELIGGDHAALRRRGQDRAHQRSAEVPETRCGA
jgi:hypothetical protein